MDICEGIEETFFISIKTAITRYIMHRYLLILEEHRHSSIYHVGINVVEEGVSIEENALIDMNFDLDLDFNLLTEQYRERICITDISNFDVVTVVTQAAINGYFYRLWKASQTLEGCMSKWSSTSYFRSTFGPMQVCLPNDSTSDTVVVYLTLREGRLALLDRSKRPVE